MRKLLGVIIVLFGIYLFVHSVMGIDLNFDLGGWKSKGSNQEVSSPVTNIQTIDIQVPSADLQIISEERTDVMAVLRGNHIDKYNLEMHQRNDKIEISVNESDFSWFNFNQNLKVIVYVPKSYNQKLHLETQSGNLEFSGESRIEPKYLQEVAVEVGSGDVVLKNLETDHLNIETASGNLKTDWVKAKKGTISLTSGDIEMNHYTGAFDADVTSGTLDTQVEELTGDINVNTTSGDVELELPKNADIALDAEVTSGDINSDYPLENITKDDEEKTLSGSNGSATYKVNLEAISGSITIR